MSQENVEIVRAAIDAYNRGDLDAAFKDAAPGYEIDMSRAVGVVRGVYGLPQIQRILEEFRSAWESDQFGADEFIDAGEHVVTPFTNHLRGRDGIEVEARGIWVWTIRDGAIVRSCLYQEREEALEAAGVRE
jgi:ketosteroid isomerase-like protein